MNKIYFFLFLFVNFFSYAQEKIWVINKDHSYISFAAFYLGGAEVKGQFKRFSGNVIFDSDWNKAELEIESASIDTNNSLRDNHLRSSDFFNATAYPQIKFESHSIAKQKDGLYLVHGTLYLMGKKLNVHYLCSLIELPRDRWGKENRVVKLSTKLSRKELGISWTAFNQSGGIELVGDRIDIEAQWQIQPQGEVTVSSKFMIPIIQSNIKKSHNFNQPKRQDQNLEISNSILNVSKMKPGFENRTSGPSEVSFKRFGITHYFAIFFLMFVGVVGIGVMGYFGKGWMNNHIPHYKELGIWGIISDLILMALLIGHLWSIWVLALLV